MRFVAAFGLDALDLAIALGVAVTVATASTARRSISPLIAAAAGVGRDYLDRAHLAFAG